MTTSASTETGDHGSSRSVLRSSAVMAAGTMVSRILGLVRTILLASVLGATTGVGNAFGTANTLPNMVYILLAGGVLNAVLVPQMARALKHEDAGQGYTDRLLTLAMSILLGVTIVFTVAAPLAYGLMDVAGNTPSRLGIAFTYVCLPQILFYGIYTLLGEALNARGRFGAFMWSPVLANVISIIGLVWFWMGTSPDEVADPNRWTWKMVAVLAGSSTLGIIAQALVLIIPLRRSGYRFRPNFHFRGVGLRTASTIAIWAFAAVVVQQVGLIVSTNVLNSVPQGFGGTLAQQNAFLLFMLPHSIVTISLVTALYTRLSHAAAEGRVHAVKADLDTGLRLSGLASIAVTFGSLVLVVPLSQVLFWNKGGSAIGEMTIAMMLGLVPFTVCVLVQRVFYAYEDAKTPFWMQVACTAVAVVVTLVAATFPPRWIGPGVALAQTLSYVVQAGIGWFWLQRRIGHVQISGAIRTYVRLSVAAIAATAVAAVVRWGLGAVIGQDSRMDNLLIVIVGGLLFLATYLVLGKRFGVEEVGQLLNPVLSRVPGARRAPAPVEAAAPGTRAAARQAEQSAAQQPEPDSSDDHTLRELAIGDPAHDARLFRPVAPLPGMTERSGSRWPNMWDGDHTMVVPSLGEGVVADTAPIPLRVRLPESRVQVRPDTAGAGTHLPGGSAANLRMGRGGDGEQPSSAPDRTEQNNDNEAIEGASRVQHVENGHILAGRYVLNQAIASNDHKQVWQATDQTLSRDVTATIFDADSAHAAAALDSARRAAAVEDRHLPRVLDVGTEGDLSYVVHESLGGAESIASMLQFDPLPAEEARRMVGEAATGLSNAAGRGLHHLALTPHEIMRGKDGSVYVVGVATDAALAGTDDLSAAEANRADTVALVQVLYAALTGTWPGKSDVRGIPDADRKGDRVASVTSVRSTVPSDLNSLCSTVLDDDAGPRTPGELAGLLAPWSPELVKQDPQPQDDNTGAAPAAAGVAATAAALPPRPSDPDATHTFDAQAMADARARDDYDPSFSDLEPPLPMLSHGVDDPDNDTSKLALAIVAAFLVAALILGVIGLKGLFSSSDSGNSGSTNRPLPSTTSATGKTGTGSAAPSKAGQPSGQKVKVNNATSFDPQGDGDEHSELADNVLDGNPNTTWVTHIYGRADYMGGRKKGAGLLLDLGKPTQVGSVKITTQGNPSTIQVFVTDQKDTVDGLTPFGEMTQQSGAQTVTGKAPATGRYVILWVTQLAKGNQGGYREKIAEVEVLS